MNTTTEILAYIKEQQKACSGKRCFSMIDEFSKQSLKNPSSEDKYVKECLKDSSIREKLYLLYESNMNSLKGCDDKESLEVLFTKMNSAELLPPAYNHLKNQSLITQYAICGDLKKSNFLNHYDKNCTFKFGWCSDNSYQIALDGELQRVQERNRNSTSSKNFEYVSNCFCSYHFYILYIYILYKYFKDE